MYSTKLTSAQGYNPKNIIFSKPEIGSIPGSVPKISFKRIRIGTKHEDGTTGDLIMETPPSLFSFGLQENRELGTGNVNGYVLPMCLWNKNGATPEEQKFTEVFESIVNQCKTHLLNSKDEIEKYELDSSDLKNFNPLYWKKEKGKIVDGAGPVLYIKTMMSKKNQKITTMFINEETNEEISPYDLMNKYCFVKGAIKFESVFIGNKISLQLKLYEALIKPMDTERRTLLTSNVVRKVETSESSDIFDVLENDTNEEEVSSTKVESSENNASGSLNGEDEESSSDEEDDDEEEDEEETTPPPTPPPTNPPPAPTKAPAKKTATTTRATKKST
jgi:hypothetical protein